MAVERDERPVSLPRQDILPHISDGDCRATRRRTAIPWHYHAGLAEQASARRGGRPDRSAVCGAPLQSLAVPFRPVSWHCARLVLPAYRLGRALCAGPRLLERNVNRCYGAATQYSRPGWYRGLYQSCFSALVVGLCWFGAGAGRIMDFP